MSGPGASRRNAVAVSLGWWFAKRLIRKRGRAVLAGVAAGEGLSLGRRRKQRHPLRALLVVLAMAAGGALWWRRRRGGDDWGDWKPSAPDAPEPAEPAPLPEQPRDFAAT